MSRSGYDALTTPFIASPSCFVPTLTSRTDIDSTYTYEFDLPESLNCSPRTPDKTPYPVGVWFPGICPSGFAPQLDLDQTAWEVGESETTTAVCCPSGYIFTDSLSTVLTSSYSDGIATVSRFVASCNSKTTVTAVTPTGTETLELGAPTGRTVLDVWGDSIEVAWQSNDTEVASIMKAQILAANQTRSSTGASQPGATTGTTQTGTQTAIVTSQPANSTIPGPGGKKNRGGRYETSIGATLVVAVLLTVLGL